MEKYFIVTEQSKLYGEYMRYIQNKKDVNDHVKEFTAKNEIKTTEYYANSGYLYIVPTENDLEKFEKVLTKPVNDGLRSFKKNSKINKQWVKSLDEKDLKVINKPVVLFYFTRGYGKTRSRLFNVDKVLYCSFEVDTTELDCPEGMVEIKASEFYKILEEN